MSVMVMESDLQHHTFPHHHLSFKQKSKGYKNFLQKKKKKRKIPKKKKGIFGSPLDLHKLVNIIILRFFKIKPSREKNFPNSR